MSLKQEMECGALINKITVVSYDILAFINLLTTIR